MEPGEIEDQELIWSPLHHFASLPEGREERRAVLYLDNLRMCSARLCRFVSVAQTEKAKPPWA